MKKRLLLSTLLAVFSVLLYGQSNASNEISFNGHSIRVFKLGSGGYGYDISYQNRLVIHQSKNPFNESASGLKTAEDALKLAKWQTLHLNPTSQTAMPSKAIPRQVARQLNIDTN